MLGNLYDGIKEKAANWEHTARFVSFQKGEFYLAFFELHEFEGVEPKKTTGTEIEYYPVLGALPEGRTSDFLYGHKAEYEYEPTGLMSLGDFNLPEPVNREGLRAILCGKEYDSGRSWLWNALKTIQKELIPEGLLSDPDEICNVGSKYLNARHVTIKKSKQKDWKYGYFRFTDAIGEYVPSPSDEPTETAGNELDANLMGKRKLSQDDDFKFKKGELYLAFYEPLEEAKNSLAAETEYLPVFIACPDGEGRVGYKYHVYAHRRHKPKPAGCMFLGDFNLSKPVFLEEFGDILVDGHFDERSSLRNLLKTVEREIISQSLPAESEEIWNIGLNFLKAHRVKSKEPKKENKVEIPDIPLFDMKGQVFDPLKPRMPPKPSPSRPDKAAK